MEGTGFYLGRQKGRIRMEREHRLLRRWRLGGCWERKKQEDRRAIEDARFYACLMQGVVVSACGLAVWSFTIF